MHNAGPNPQKPARAQTQHLACPVGDAGGSDRGRFFQSEAPSEASKGGEESVEKHTVAYRCFG